MKRIEKKRFQHERRKARVRGSVFGTPERPRMSVFRSNAQIYVQIIDDMAGRTLCAASTCSKSMSGQLKSGGNKGAAVAVGKAVAAAALVKGIRHVVFDRSGYRYHGRVKALADAAREAGLKF